MFCVAHFQGGALKSVHISNFLSNFQLNSSIATKFSEIIIVLIKNQLSFI